MTQQKNNSLPLELQKILLDDKDFLRQILNESLQSILQAEFNNFINAGNHERSKARGGQRNGSYNRGLKTRVGRMELEVCRDRQGLFHTELFRRYQRSEQALVLSMAEMYVHGVSTGKVNHIVQQLCGTEVSSSQVSKLAGELDQKLNLWRNRKLTKHYPYLVIDARYEYIRSPLGIVSKAVLIVLGISSEGKREILSIEIGDSENEADWGAMFRRLKDRGLSTVSYVVSDDHIGIVNALRRYFQGASWQRCQVHFIRNFIGRMGGRDCKRYMSDLKDVFSAPSIKDAQDRKRALVEKLEVVKPNIAQWIDEEIDFCFSVYTLPESHRKHMKSTNMLERFNEELKRRSRVIRIFPNDAACLRVLGTLCMEQSEVWETGRVYLNMQTDLEKETDKDWIWQEDLNLTSATLQSSLDSSRK